MIKSELISLLFSFKELQLPHIALYIKDSTFDKIHLFVYKPTDIDKLLDTINSKYDENSMYQDKEIIAVKAAENIDYLNTYYNKLIT